MDTNQNNYNAMCKNCERFKKCCNGTTCQVWTGCIWKIKKEKYTEDCKK